MINTASFPVPPRVIVHTAEPSGLGHYVSKFVLALDASGIPAILYCPENSNDQQEAREAGIEVVHAAPRATANSGLLARLLRNFRFLTRSIFSLARLLRKGDVVHFQGMLHLPLGFAFLLIARLRGASIVLTAHDPLPHRWRFPGSLQWIERAMLGLSYRSCDRVIAHNHYGRNVLLREFHLRDEQIHVIPHGWYPEAGASETPWPLFDRLQLLAFGSIRKNKGLHLAIAALQQLDGRARVPVHLTIAGHCDPAEQTYWRECKQLIGNNANVRLIERRIEDSEIQGIMAQHHALILPYENFSSESGVATLALSYSRPIIATPAGGLAELVTGARCGVLISAPSPDDVADAILQAIGLGSEQLHKMGTDGNRFIREMRSWKLVADLSGEVYSELMQENACLQTRDFELRVRSDHKSS
jgi:glycosyltransferase involved in cell wall biosynthesis